MKQLNRATGAIKETIAGQYVKDVKKYKILAFNYKNAIGEIDIIATDKEKRIIFIEVKYRSTAKYGYGREAVDERKIWKIRNVATIYLKEKRLSNALIRFDVMDILGDNITYIENAF